LDDLTYVSYVKKIMDVSEDCPVRRRDQLNRKMLVLLSAWQLYKKVGAPCFRVLYFSKKE
jgi:hypothetical protein